MTDVPLKPVVELAFGADLAADPDEWVWTDVSVPARRVPPSISRGRSDEASNVSPATASVVLSNQSGEYTPGNAMSPWWPNIRRGTPLRISVEVDSVRYVRFIGHVGSWEPFWPLATPKEGEQEGVAYIRVTAAGVLRRLTQGQKALESPLFRRITDTTQTPDVFGYWPMEDPSGALRAASPLPGVRSMFLGGEYNFSSDDSLPGSLPVVSIPGEKSAGWIGHLPQRTGQQWQLDFFFLLPETPETGHFPLLNVHSTGTTKRWQLDISAFADLRLRGFDSAGSVQFTTSIVNVEHFGQWIQVQLLVRQQGSRVVRTLRSGPIGSLGMQASAASVLGHRIGRPTNVANLFTTAPPGGYSFAHIVMSATSHLNWLWAPSVAHLGEPAATRADRLCGEESVPVEIVGNAASSEPMGIQRPLALVPLLEECATAGGVLSESIETLGLRFRTNDSLANQLPALIADVTERGLAEPFEPVLDDQRLRNDVEVNIPDGASVHVTDDDHIAAEGRYDTSTDINVATERRLEQHAGWRLALGTLPDMRYPQLSANLRASRQFAEWADVDLGDRVRGRNLPRQHPDDVDVLIEGWTETLSGFGWDVTANCSPAAPWTVGVLAEGGAVELEPNARWNIFEPALAAPFTWTAWVRPDTLPADFSALFYLGEVDYSNHIAVFIHNATSRISVWDDTFSNRAQTDPVTLDEWLFLALTVTASGDIVLYWRSEDDFMLSSDTGTFAGNPLVTDYLYLGSDRNAPNFLHTFDGAMAHARVFETALSEDQALEESGATVAVNTVWGDWPLNETSGLDVSGNDNHLDLEVGTGSATVVPGPDLELPRLDTDGSELVPAVDDTETGAWDVEVTEGEPWTTDAIYFPLGIELGGEVVTVSGIAGGGAGIDAVHGLGQADPDTASTSHVAPSVDAVGAADLLLCGWCSWSDPGTYTVPGSMTAGPATTGTWGTMQTATEVLAASGATGTRTATFSVSDRWAGVSVIAHRSLAGSPVIEEVLSDVSTGQPTPDITLTTDPSTQEDWWLVAWHTWTSDNGLMGAPSGDGWGLVADSAVLGSAPRIRVWARRVGEAGEQAVTFAGRDNGESDSQHARLYVLSGVTSTIQTFTVSERSVNGVVKSHPAGTAIRVANPIRLSL